MSRDRQVFLGLDSTAFNVAVLTADTLYLGIHNPRLLLDAEKRLSAGEALPEVLGTGVVSIPLDRIQALQVEIGDMGMGKVLIGAVEDERPVERTFRSSKPLEMFLTLRRSLGSNWREKTTPSTAWSAAKMPLIFTFFLAFMFLLAIGAKLQDEAKVRQPGEKPRSPLAAVPLPVYVALCGLTVVVGLALTVQQVRNRLPAKILIERPADGSAP